MQNLSIGKLIGIFVAFMVAVGTAAVFIMKNSEQPAETTVVMKKRHKVEQAQAAPQAPSEPATAASAPATDQMMGLPSTASASQVETAPSPSPVGASTLPVNIAQSGMTSTPTSSAAPVTQAQAECIDKGPVQAVRTKRHKQAAKARKPVVKPEPDRELTRMDGYKTLAVVGHRAWISDRDGSPDNVAKGEEIVATKPVRVRSVDKESSVVITTTDQYIDAH